jgi:hypothetical protein
LLTRPLRVHVRSVLSKKIPASARRISGVSTGLAVLKAEAFVFKALDRGARVHHSIANGQRGNQRPEAICHKCCRTGKSPAWVPLPFMRTM